MQTFESKLIVLRGNSGSGKTTTASAIRETSSEPNVALIEQDYLRRIVLKEKDIDSGNNIELIKQVTVFALSKSYHVILEGILYFPHYGRMLEQLRNMCPDNYFYYFDISLEETLRRHATKPNSHEFGEAQMRSWYNANELTHFSSEKIVPETMSQAEIVELIKSDTGL